MFKPADPTKRRPAWLQSHTKENLIWQIAMIPVIIILSELWDRYQDRKMLEAVDKIMEETPPVAK